jgi:outer membrane protein assembly factor BamD (BamD/ComL family)
MRDLLAEHEYRVASFYFNRKAWEAAKGRYDLVLGAFPDFWKLDRVLYEAGWVEYRLGRPEDARLLVQKLSEAFPESPLLKKKLPVPATPAAPPNPAPVASVGGGV